MLTLNNLKVLYCKKNWGGIFEVGEYYNVNGGEGDPEKAIELGYTYDIPLELMTVIYITNSKDGTVSETFGFRVHQNKRKVYPYLWTYFCTQSEIRKKKLKKIEKKSP